MQMSGINLDKAHSTRAASVSAAHRAPVPIQEILNKAGWSSVETFAIFIIASVWTPQRAVSLSFRKLF